MNEIFQTLALFEPASLTLGQESTEIHRSLLEYIAQGGPIGMIIILISFVAIGVSLLGEPETNSNERGVIELIHIIVRLDQINGPLAVLASQIANEYLIRTDRKQWGSELMFDARSVSVGGQSRTRTKEPNAHE